MRTKMFLAAAAVMMVILVAGCDQVSEKNESVPKVDSGDKFMTVEPIDPPDDIVCPGCTETCLHPWGRSGNLEGECVNEQQISDICAELAFANGSIRACGEMTYMLDENNWYKVDCSASCPPSAPVCSTEGFCVADDCEAETLTCVGLTSPEGEQACTSASTHHYDECGIELEDCEACSEGEMCDLDGYCRQRPCVPTTLTCADVPNNGNGEVACGDQHFDECGTLLDDCAPCSTGFTCSEEGYCVEDACVPTMVCEDLVGPNGESACGGDSHVNECGEFMSCSVDCIGDLTCSDIGWCGCEVGQVGAAEVNCYLPDFSMVAGANRDCRMSYRLSNGNAGSQILGYDSSGNPINKVYYTVTFNQSDDGPFPVALALACGDGLIQTKRVYNLTWILGRLSHSGSGAPDPTRSDFVSIAFDHVEMGTVTLAVTSRNVPAQ